MTKIAYNLVVLVLFAFILWGCCKNKNECVEGSFRVQPFIEKYGDFWCTGNNEYTYIFNHKYQIDSLSYCTFSPPVAFPIDETDMVYIMVGKMAYHYRDTFYSKLFKDTCSKKLTYEVNMVQRDTVYNTFPGVVSMFCSIENIPADYQVEVKYKYVPLPE